MSMRCPVFGLLDDPFLASLGRIPDASLVSGSVSGLETFGLLISLARSEASCGLVIVLVCYRLGYSLTVYSLHTGSI
jgi:hypothetical protein